MLVVDYDGTLAASDYKVSESTRKKFIEAGEKNVIRVINTGRSLFSLNTVLDEDFPLDYLVFSTGIGIYDWKDKNLLADYEISEIETFEVYNYLCEQDFDFMVQLPVPDNHYFHHFGDKNRNADFKSRVSNYEAYGIKPISNCPRAASQFVIICPENKDYFEQIRLRFPYLKVVKATSPINHKSIWVEILPKGVSKSSGIEFLMKKLSIPLNEIIVVGNDFYDLDMLNFVTSENAYVVSNAPETLKKTFNVIETNDEDAVAKLIAAIYLY